MILQRRVEFCETDAAGIAHFSAFFAYMEQAEHELLRRCGTSVMVFEAEGKISWPRVAVSCNYTGAVKFEDMLHVAVAVEHMGRSSVTYHFRFTHAERPVADGKITAVCCRFTGEERPRPIPIPAELAAKLAEYALEAE